MSEKKHYSIPTNLHKEPFLSVWKMEDVHDTICYIQISENENHPIWMRYGDVIEMLSRHVANFEKTILLDVITALKFHESISPELIKKHIIR
ncbi:hypothetical protein [Methylobacter sp.]|uniref:hypothetical protein n=1 Tax=Methylobacter sp. TaxID=2051955 RepID=UPI003DA4DC6E